MYIIEDRLTPAIVGYMNGVKTKNIFLRYFPTTMVNGVKVFDKLYLYNGHVITDENPNRKLYRLLNIKVSDLEKEDWKGVENYYLYLQRYEESQDISIQDIKDYIVENMPLVSEGKSAWSTTKLVYDPVDTNAPAYIDDVSIQDNIVGNKKDISFSPEDDHPLTALALLDVDSVMFEKQFIVTYKNIVTRSRNHAVLNNSVNQSHYVLLANIDMKFRRIAEVDDVVVADFLTSIQATVSEIGTIPDEVLSSTNIKSSTSIYTNTVSESKENSINTQLLNMLHEKVSLSETNLVYPYDGNYYIKYSGMENLSVYDFSRVLGQLITTGFKKKSAETWQKVLVAVVIIAIIVLAFYSGGAALELLPSTATLTEMVLAYSAAAAFVLGAGTLALSLVAKFLVNKGQYAAAAFIAGSMQILGTLSTVFGIVSLVGSWTTAITQAIKEITMKTVTEGLSQMVVSYLKQATSDILGFVTSWTTTAFQVYAKVINPPTKGLGGLQEEIAKQEEELEDYATPDFQKQVQYIFESPYGNIYDMNEYMQNIPYIMTQGKIDNATTKYYS